MDRTSTRAARCLCVAFVALTVSGSGCAKMRKYRSQDSPLPGSSSLKPTKRGFLRGKTVPPAPDGANIGREGEVAWTGELNTVPPATRRAAPTRNAEPGPRLSLPAPELAAVEEKPREGTAAGPAEVDAGVAKVHSLIREGQERMAQIASYQVTVDGQERVNGSLQPSESARLSLRRDPRAIRLEWPTGRHKGREVIWSASEGSGMMHVHVGESLLPVPDLTLAPDNPMLMRYSRHPITDAGLESILDKLDQSLKSHEQRPSDGERFSYDGVRIPPEIGRPCHAITRVTPSGSTWLVALDIETNLPALVQEVAAGGDLLERYIFRDLAIDPATLADVSAFDPQRRWGGSKGLLGRLSPGNTSVK